MSDQTATASGSEPREATVHGSAKGFAQEISVGRHRLLADEPVSEDGTDTGPGPYDVHKTLTSEIDIRTRLV